MLTFTAIRHAWPEKEGFRLKREHGLSQYVFVHFSNEVDILLDNRTVTIPKHSCVLYRPGTPQYIYSRQTLIHDWFHFTGDPSPILREARMAADTLLVPSRGDYITGIIREMENEFFMKKRGYEALLDAKFAELVLKLSRDAEGEHTEMIDDTTAERLRRLRGQVFLSLDHPWTVKEMAERTRLSPSRFHSVYRSVYGNSPMDDLIHARIESAKNALLYGSRSVSSIADSLGYNNVTHFIRQFRSITGISPLRYRKENGVEEG